jgi:hypothetical protein
LECIEGSCGVRCSPEAPNGYCPAGFGCIEGSCRGDCSPELLNGWCPGDNVCKENGVCGPKDAATDDGNSDGKSDDDGTNTDLPPAPEPGRSDSDDNSTQPKSGCDCHGAGSPADIWPAALYGLWFIFKRRRVIL